MVVEKKKVRGLAKSKSGIEAEKEAAVTACTGHLVCNSSICGGCKKCEIVCSLFKEGVISPSVARIVVKRDIFDGYICEAISCLQCDGPECLFACPVLGALYVDETTGARVIDSKKCIGCKLCIKACPATPKGILYDAGRKVCFKCDLCGGNPQCVKFCPTGALTFEKAKRAKINARFIRLDR